MTGIDGFGARLGYARTTAGLTQAELAKRIHYTKAAIQNWEYGRRLPRIDAVAQLAEVLGVSVNYLITGEENK